MSRYLTPFRISLLVLITAYSDGLVSSSASISVLSFIVSHLLPIHSKLRERDEGHDQDDFTLSIERLQKATIIHGSAIPGRTVWDLVLKNLWAIASLDALHTFFDDLSYLLEKPVEQGLRQDYSDSQRPKRMLLSRNSPLGAFVRRAQLEFTRLQFHDGISLWKELVVFRRPTLALWKQRNPGVGSNTFDTNLQQDSVDGKLVGLVYGRLSCNTSESIQTSTEDMERILDYQISRMQCRFPRRRCLILFVLKLKGLLDQGNRVPQEIQVQLRKMAKPSTSIPAVTYYMQCVAPVSCHSYIHSRRQVPRSMEVW